MRLIDADALIDRLDTDEYGMRLPKAVVGLTKVLLDEAPTINAGRPQEWIPCKERLPARQGYYICTCKDGSRVLKTTTIKWSNGWQLSGTRAYWKVIAWQPLPEPWKGADDE